MQVLKKLFLQNKVGKKIFGQNVFNQNTFVIRTLIVLFAVVLFFLVGYPLLMLFLNSLGITVNGVDFTLRAYFRAFADQQTISALFNTLDLALGVVVMAGLVGGGLAWLVVRTNLPFKKLINRLVFLTHIIPSYIMAVAWIELLGHNGLIHNFFIDKLGYESFPLEIYSIKGVIFVMGLHLYPLVYMALRNALLKTDNSLEKAAIMSGAGRFRVLRTITLPLIKPSICSISLFVLARTISCFGVAAILALPVKKYVLTTYIYTALNSLDLKLATAISIILVLFSGGIFLVQGIVLNKRYYTFVNTNSNTVETISLGKYKKPLIILVVIFFLITLVLPLVIIIMSSLLKSWGLDFKLLNLSLLNYSQILFEEELTVRALRNSIFNGIIAATVAVVLGSIASYISHRAKFRGKGLLEFLASWPMAVPTTVMAVAAILAWINPPLKLYNTPWIIIVTYIAVCLPFVVRNVSGLIQNLDPELEKMARVSGASYLKTYWDITIPLIKPGLKTGWILSFLFALREIPISVMLYASGTETVGVLLFNLRSDTGGLEMVSAVAVIVITITIIGHVLISNYERIKWW